MRFHSAAGPVNVVRMEALATPCLVVDAAAVRRNLKRLAEYTARHALRVRPHTKTHKSQRMARLQLECGASGLTAAKLGEAEVMARVAPPNGPADILLAYPAVDEARCSGAARLAAATTLRVAVDSIFAADALSAAARQARSTIGILVDLDVGLGRTGVASPQEALTLAQAVSRCAGLRLDGLFFYPGHIWSRPAEQSAVLERVNARIAETLELWRAHGLQAEIVSGGSTPTAYQSHLVARQTEIRPGTYIYNDMNTVRGGFCAIDDCAARFTCTVVSDAVKGQVVIDAGSKTLTSDRCIPALESGHGFILEYPEATIAKLSEEHGQVDVTRCPRAPRIGERVTVIPNHICPCVNLQDRVWWQQDGRMESLSIDARGRLS